MFILTNVQVQGAIVVALLVWLSVVTAWGRMKLAELEKAKRDINGVGNTARAALQLTAKLAPPTSDPLAPPREVDQSRGGVR